MKKILLRVAGLAGVVGVTLALSSCMYDSSYYGTSSSYGYGSGYGGSTFSTSYFVTTGDPLWGYDPHVRSYYHYPTRRYYDPYLNGYYPVGYRPHYVVGVPHPHGWDGRRRWAPPPRRVRDHRLRHYENRADAYRRTDYAWAKQVRRADAPRREPNRPQSGHVRPGHSTPGYSSGRNPSHSGRNPAVRPDRNPREHSRPAVRPQTPPRFPSRDISPSRGESTRPSFQGGRRPSVRPQATTGGRPQLEVRNRQPQDSGRSSRMAQGPAYSPSRVPVTTAVPSRGGRDAGVRAARVNSRSEDHRGEGSRNPTRGARGR